MLERLERLSTKMMEFSSFLDSAENAIISDINKVISKINELQEFFLKGQNSARPTLTEVKGFDIQYEAENVIVFYNKWSNIVNVLSDIKTISDGFDAYYGLLLPSNIMTTMGFIVNLALEVYTFNIDIVLCRKVYDPGGKILY
jgi:hypothetical protein